RTASPGRRTDPSPNSTRAPAARNVNGVTVLIDRLPAGEAQGPPVWSRSPSVRGRMRIADIRLHRLEERLDPPFAAAWNPSPRTSLAATVVELTTDEGVVGYVSGDTMDAFERFTDMFVGENLFAVTRHVRVLETLAFHHGRYWPLEAAIWDAVGKTLGVPVSVLFGGAQDKVAAYASTGEIRAPAERVESAIA